MRYTFGIIAFFSASLTACNPPGERYIVAPDSAAQTSAQEFQSRFPQAQVFYSPRRGTVLGVFSGSVPLPYQAASSTAAAALLAVQQFLSDEPALFGIEDPRQEIRPAPNGYEWRQSADDRGGTTSLRFEQIDPEGNRVRDYYGVALFDSMHRLLALFTQTRPTQQLREEIARRENEEATMGALAAPLLGALPPPPLLSPNLRMLAPTRTWIRAGTNLRLVREETLKRGIYTERRLYDARGRILQERLDLPSERVEEPSDWNYRTLSVSSPAPDLQGDAQEMPHGLFVGGPALLLTAFQVPDVFSPYQYVVIGDSASLPDRSFVNVHPVATTAASWHDETAYSDLRDITWLAKNLATTIAFYRDAFDLASWDNRGSTFHAAVRGRGRLAGPRPDVNAYGGNGYLLVGDGYSPTGQAVSEALDVVGHEYTHSVISAFPDFFYDHEAGVIHESLADFIGMTVAGHSSNEIGAAAGWPLRDLAEPARYGQPELYGDYEDLPLDQDNGGVHRNSGILNRALYRTAQRLSTAHMDAATPLSRLIIESLQDVAWSPQSLLEDFAVGLVVTCQQRAYAARLPAGASASLCSVLAEELVASELLSPAR